MQPLNEEQLVTIEIDFEEMKKNRDQLNESWFAMFGGVVKLILDKMFSGSYRRSDPSFYVKGSRTDVTSFARALGREKKYLDALAKHGLDNPQTFNDKKKLDLAIKNFEGATKLKWPFK